MCLSQLKSDLFKTILVLRADQTRKQQFSLLLKGSWVLYILHNVLFLLCSNNSLWTCLPAPWAVQRESSVLDPSVPVVPCFASCTSGYTDLLLPQALHPWAVTRCCLLQSRTVLFVTVHPGEVQCPLLAPEKGCGEDCVARGTGRRCRRLGFTDKSARFGKHHISLWYSLPFCAF